MQATAVINIFKVIIYQEISDWICINGNYAYAFGF